jgi:hypothetical protein
VAVALSSSAAADAPQLDPTPVTEIDSQAGSGAAKWKLLFFVPPQLARADFFDVNSLAFRPDFHTLAGHDQLPIIGSKEQRQRRDIRDITWQCKHIRVQLRTRLECSAKDVRGKVAGVSCNPPVVKFKHDILSNANSVINSWPPGTLMDVGWSEGEYDGSL